MKQTSRNLIKYNLESIVKEFTERLEKFPQHLKDIDTKSIGPDSYEIFVSSVAYQCDLLLYTGSYSNYAFYNHLPDSVKKAICRVEFVNRERYKSQTFTWLRLPLPSLPTPTLLKEALDNLIEFDSGLYIAKYKRTHAPFFSAYIATALELCQDADNQHRYQEEGVEEKRYMEREGLAPETLKALENDAMHFIREVAFWLESSDDLEQVGTDFWLTRNGHGSGFWHREYRNKDFLTEIAKAFPEVDLYFGDDGLIYQQ